MTCGSGSHRLDRDPDGLRPRPRGVEASRIRTAGLARRDPKRPSARGPGEPQGEASGVVGEPCETRVAARSGRRSNSTRPARRLSSGPSPGRPRFRRTSQWRRMRPARTDVTRPAASLPSATSAGRSRGAWRRQPWRAANWDAVRPADHRRPTREDRRFRELRFPAPLARRFTTHSGSYNRRDGPGVLPPAR